MLLFYGTSNLKLNNCQKAPIDPFTRESDKPSASQGVPLGGMGCVLSDDCFAVNPSILSVVKII